MTQGSTYEDFNQVEDIYPQEQGSTAEDFIGDEEREPGVWDKDEMADRLRDKIDNGELVLCRECKREVHNPYFKRCWNCNQGLRNRTRAAEMGNDDGREPVISW